MPSSLNGTGVTFSNGTQQSTAATGTVTSITAGSGLTGGTISTSGTISLDIYTGTAFNNTAYPIGSYVFVGFNSTQYAVNATTPMYTGANTATSFFATFVLGTGAVAVAGTWRNRGGMGGCTYTYLAQRVA